MELTSNYTCLTFYVLSASADINGVIGGVCLQVTKLSGKDGEKRTPDCCLQHSQVSVALAELFLAKILADKTFLCKLANS